MAREDICDPNAFKLAQALDLWAMGERPDFPYDDLKMTCRMAADQIEALDKLAETLARDI